MKSGIKFRTVDQYIRSFEGIQQQRLLEMRKIVKENAPGAEELISYNMPAFRLNKILLYYAAYEKHLGFYPAGSVIQTVFAKELAGYETSKGTIRFPIGKKLPAGLIKKIVKYRVKQNAG